VNWSPGIINPFRELGRFGQSLDTILEQCRAGREDPVVLLLHLACPRVEYTDRGKSAVIVAGQDDSASDGSQATAGARQGDKNDEDMPEPYVEE
jgi:hypothetical protein